MIDGKFHFSLTFTTNLFLLNQKQKWYVSETHDIMHTSQMK